MSDRSDLTVPETLAYALFDTVEENDPDAEVISRSQLVDLANAAYIAGVQGKRFPEEEEEPYYQAICGSWDCRAPECKPKDM